MANSIEGSVVSIDSQGNLVTDISRDQLSGAPVDESVTVHCDGHETYGIFQSPEGQPPMTLIAVYGNEGQLELSIVDDSAKIMLGVSVGAAVKVSW